LKRPGLPRLLIKFALVDAAKTLSNRKAGNGKVSAFDIPITDSHRRRLRVDVAIGVAAGSRMRIDSDPTGVQRRRIISPLARGNFSGQLFSSIFINAYETVCYSAHSNPSTAQENTNKVIALYILMILFRVPIRSSALAIFRMRAFCRGRQWMPMDDVIRLASATATPPILALEQPPLKF
jgi:hypothetical protein